jgi:hypothetical protein
MPPDCQLRNSRYESEIFDNLLAFCRDFDLRHSKNAYMKCIIPAANWDIITSFLSGASISPKMPNKSRQIVLFARHG